MKSSMVLVFVPPTITPRILGVPLALPIVTTTLLKEVALVIPTILSVMVNAWLLHTVLSILFGMPLLKDVNATLLVNTSLMAIVKCALLIVTGTGHHVFAMLDITLVAHLVSRHASMVLGMELPVFAGAGTM